MASSDPEAVCEREVERWSRMGRSSSVVKTSGAGSEGSIVMRSRLSVGVQEERCNMSITGTVGNRRGSEVEQVEGRPSRYHTKARTRHDEGNAFA